MSEKICACGHGDGKMKFLKAKRGQQLFFGLMISVMIWIAFSQLLGPVKSTLEDARATDQLDCTNTSISVGTKATCVVVDYTLFGWAIAIISLILGAAGGRLLDQARKKE